MTQSTQLRNLNRLWKPGGVMGDTPDTRRGLTVVPSIQIEGTTVRPRWGYGGMSGR